MSDIPRRYDGVQYREASVEHVDAEHGTLLARVVPYDVETQLDMDLWESFAPKAFERASNAPGRCKMWHRHGGPLVGHATSVEDRPDGLWVLAQFSKTLNAEEARELARDGSLDQVSVTFRPYPTSMDVERRDDGMHVRHHRGAMLGFALVEHAAYGEHSFIASVRDARVDREVEAALARLRALTH